MAIHQRTDAIEQETINASVKYMDAILHDRIFATRDAGEIIYPILEHTPGFRQNSEDAIVSFLEVSENFIDYDGDFDDAAHYVVQNGTVTMRWNYDTDVNMAIAAYEYLLRKHPELDKTSIEDVEDRMQRWAGSYDFYEFVSEYMLMSDDYVNGSRYTIGISLSDEHYAILKERTDAKRQERG